MSKKETIEQRVKSLTEREQKLKFQLDSDSDEMKEKAKRVGKIALVAGVVALLGYWIFKVIFHDDEAEEEDRPKKKKKKRDTDGISSKVTAFILPYIGKMLDGLLDEDEEESKKKKELEESEED